MNTLAHSARCHWRSSAAASSPCAARADLAYQRISGAGNILRIFRPRRVRLAVRGRAHEAGRGGAKTTSGAQWLGPSIYVGTDGVLYAELFRAGVTAPLPSAPRKVNDGTFHDVAVTDDTMAPPGGRIMPKALPLRAVTAVGAAREASQHCVALVLELLDQANLRGVVAE